MRAKALSSGYDNLQCFIVLLLLEVYSGSTLVSTPLKNFFGASGNFLEVVHKIESRQDFESVQFYAENPGNKFYIFLEDTNVVTMHFHPTI